MKEVTRYEAEDGTLFETREEAIKYEEIENEREFLSNLISEYCNNTDAILPGESVCKFIMENKKVLIRGLKGLT